MSVVENIVGAIVVIGVAVIITLIAGVQFFESSMPETQLSMRDFLHDQHNNNMQEFLEAKNNATNISFADLFAVAIAKNNEMIEYDGQQLNVSDEAKKVLDKMYERNNYHFSIMPIFDTVYFRFVLDGSGSFEDERVLIKQSILDMEPYVQQVKQLYGDFDVVFHVYILKKVLDSQRYIDDPEQDPCSIFLDTDINCQVVSATQLNRLPHITPMNTQGLQYGILDYLYESDWIGGTVFAANQFKAEIADDTYISLNFIMPMSDELSRSSYHRDCFNSSWISTGQQVICGLCKGGCNTRGEGQIAEIQEYEILTKQDTVIPLYTFGCSIPPDVINTIGVPQVLQFSDTGSAPGLSGNWCNFNNCEACTYTGEYYCLHPECQDELLNQMETLATMTDGSVLTVNNIDNLPQDIMQVVQTAIKEKGISYGNTGLNDKFVYNELIYLPDGAKTKIILQVGQ